MKVNELFEDGRLHFLSDTPEDELIDTIKSECSEIFDIYKQTGFKNLFYRGEKDANDKYEPFKASIRTNRKPVQMPEELHNKLNASMLRVGLKAHRGNSIFTTSNFMIASDWGNLCVIFPTNGFNYTWFNNIKTSYVFHDIQYFFEKVIQFKQDYKDFIIKIKDPISFNKLKKQYNMINPRLKFGDKYADLQQLSIKAFFEFGLDGKKPVLITTFENNLWDNFIKNEITAKTTDIENPLRNKGEVLFSDCEYYGIPIRGLIRNNSIIQRLKNES